MKDQQQNKPGQSKEQQSQKEQQLPKTPKGDSANTTLTKPEQAPPASPDERTEGIP